MKLSKYLVENNMDLKKFIVLNNEPFNLETNIHEEAVTMYNQDDTYVLEFGFDEIDKFIEALESLKELLNKEV